MATKAPRIPFSNRKDHYINIPTTISASNSHIPAFFYLEISVILATQEASEVAIQEPCLLTHDSPDLLKSLQYYILHYYPQFIPVKL